MHGKPNKVFVVEKQSMEIVDEERETTESNKKDVIYALLSPLLMALKIGGIFYDASGSRLQLYYCIAIQIWIWLNITRMLTIFRPTDVFGPVLFQKILYIGWMFLCGINGLSILRSCWKPDAFNGMLEAWSIVYPNKCMAVSCARYARKRTIILTSIGWIILVMNMGFIVYGLFWSSIVDGVVVPFDLLPDNTKILFALKIVYVVTHFYFSISWIFPPIYCCLLGVIIYKNYQYFNMKFSEKVSNHLFHGDFSFYRRKHSEMTELVEKADNIMSIHIASALSINILLLCLVLYNIIYNRSILLHPMVLTMHIFWFTAGIVNLAVDALGGGMLNEAVNNISRNL